MSRLLLLLLLSLFPNPRIQIRAGEPIKLDGKIDEGEWKDAFSSKRPLPHGRAMTIRFKRTGPWLALALEADRAYEGEIIQMFVADHEGSWISSLILGVGQPHLAPCAWRRGPPSLVEKVRPQTPRACLVRLQLQEGAWSVEYLIRMDALGIGRADGRRFRGLLQVLHPRHDVLMSVPDHAVTNPLEPFEYAELASEDGWGEQEQWPSPTPEQSLEFDDNELLFLLHLEHKGGMQGGWPDQLVIASAVTPRSLAKIDALRKRLEGGRERNPGLPGWQLYLGRLLHEANFHAEARKIIDAIPPRLMMHGAFVKLAADHYFETGEHQKALDLLDKHLGPDANNDLKNAVLAAKEQWESELKARERDAQNVEKLPLVVLVTPRGKIVLELFEDDAPVAVRNFVDLVQNGFYDNLRFSVAGGMFAQSGDPRTGPASKAKLDGPGWRIPPDPKGRHLVRGAIAMFPDLTGEMVHGSRFIITTVPLPGDDAKYVVFGRVVEGLDVLDALEHEDRIGSMKVIRKRNHRYMPRGRTK